MEIFILLVIFIVYKIYKGIVESVEVPGEYHRNVDLEKADSIRVSKGQLTVKQFKKNIRNGKYR